MKQDLLNFLHWTPEQLFPLLELAKQVKQSPVEYQTTLAGKAIVGLFEKPSLRTRLSFDIGINKLGGSFHYLDSKQDKLAGRETTKDTAANIGCWADAIVARVYSHETLQVMAKSTEVPVINALCDLYHPCQAIADYLTITEAFGDVQKPTIAYVGDGNNVAHSLMIVGAILGAKVNVVVPSGFEPNKQVIEQSAVLAKQHGGIIEVTSGIENFTQADVIYTDTWLSMGDDTPLEEIKSQFAPFQLNEDMMQKTGAQFAMHCQPAHRELEITSEVMDSQQSLLMQQAENRMHGQNAILLTLLNCI